ncbi:MAG: hypothetical protein JNL04_22785 [Rhodospirillaceae bacterium]|nr:hypothetical protein [Rhodospirillaceae bacterium]
MASSLSRAALLTLKALAQGALPVPVIAPKVMCELTIAGYADIAVESLRLFGKPVSMLEITETGRNYARTIFDASDAPRPRPEEGRTSK